MKNIQMNIYLEYAFLASILLQSMSIKHQHQLLCVTKETDIQLHIHTQYIHEPCLAQRLLYVSAFVAVLGLSLGRNKMGHFGFVQFSFKLSLKKINSSNFSFAIKNKESTKEIL